MMGRNLLRAYLALLLAAALYCLVCSGILGWANHQVDQKNPQEALRYYRLLGQIAPGFPDVFVWQGWRECELGHLAEASSLAEAARRRDPQSLEVPRLLGQIAYLEGRYEEALDYWKDDPLGRGWAYYGMGRLRESLECLQTCPAMEPGREDLRKALEEAGQPTE